MLQHSVARKHYVCHKAEASHPHRVENPPPAMVASQITEMAVHRKHDSDSDGYIGGSPLLVTIQSKAGSGIGPAKQEDSENSHFDGSEDDEDDETEKDNDKLRHKGALRKQGGDDTDENALPSVTIIPSTEYVDFKMQPNSLMFLKNSKSTTIEHG